MFSAKVCYDIKLCIHIEKFRASFTIYVKVTTEPVICSHS